MSIRIQKKSWQPIKIPKINEILFSSGFAKKYSYIFLRFKQNQIMRIRDFFIYESLIPSNQSISYSYLKR